MGRDIKEDKLIWVVFFLLLVLLLILGIGFSVTREVRIRREYWDSHVPDSKTRNRYTYLFFSFGLGFMLIFFCLFIDRFQSTAWFDILAVPIVFTGYANISFTIFAAALMGFEQKYVAGSYFVQLIRELDVSENIIREVMSQDRFQKRNRRGRWANVSVTYHGNQFCIYGEDKGRIGPQFPFIGVSTGLAFVEDGSKRIKTKMMANVRSALTDILSTMPRAEVFRDHQIVCCALPMLKGSKLDPRITSMLLRRIMDTFIDCQNVDSATANP